VASGLAQSTRTTAAIGAFAFVVAAGAGAVYLTVAASPDSPAGATATTSVTTPTTTGQGLFTAAPSEVIVIDATPRLSEPLSGQVTVAVPAEQPTPAKTVAGYKDAGYSPEEHAPEDHEEHEAEEGQDHDDD
jgi:hypothetical protein